MPSLNRALISILAIALAACASVEAGAQEAQPAPVQRSLIEIYRIAPGQHEAFLRFVAQVDQINAEVGMPPRELYVHQDGADWDFIIIQPAESPPGSEERIAEAVRRLNIPTGINFFIEARRYIAEHSDTFARGPTDAATVLGELDQLRREQRRR